MPKISVVIPCYNVAPYVAKCLDTLTNQTLNDIEIICIAFMLIASMNFSLYYKIFRGDWEAFKNDTEHRYYLGMLAVAATAIAFDLYNAGYMKQSESIVDPANIYPDRNWPDEALEIIANQL